jgi:hypothetical protein
LFAEAISNPGDVLRTTHNSCIAEDPVAVTVHHNHTFVYSSHDIDGVSTVGTLSASKVKKFHLVVSVIPVNALLALSINAQLSI